VDARGSRPAAGPELQSLIDDSKRACDLADDSDSKELFSRIAELAFRALADSAELEFGHV